MKFPKLLTKAIIYGNKIYFRYKPIDISDEHLVEYMQWKGFMKINVLTKAKLRNIYKSGKYQKEIGALFKHNIIET